MFVNLVGRARKEADTCGGEPAQKANGFHSRKTEDYRQNGEKASTHCFLLLQV